MSRPGGAGGIASTAGDAVAGEGTDAGRDDLRAAVQEGRDGWLFLVGGTNRVRRQYRADPASWLRLRRWRALIAYRAARAAGLGIRLAHVVVPEKLTVYADLCPELGVDWRLSPALRLGRLLAARGNATWIDLVAPMRAARDGTELYRRTDTHWSPEGCLLAYEAICRALGVAPRDDLLQRPSVEAELALDLGGKLDPPRLERVRVHTFQRDAARVHAGPLLAAHEAAGRAEDLHVGAHAVFRNPTAPARIRMVLFGDSCAHFAPIMLTGMLAETVAELHFIWSANLDWAYVERVRPDVLVCEMAERFLRRVPQDAFDLDAEQSARLGRLAGAGAL